MTWQCHTAGWTPLDKERAGCRRAVGIRPQSGWSTTTAPSCWGGTKGTQSFWLWLIVPEWCRGLCPTAIRAPKGRNTHLNSRNTWMWRCTVAAERIAESTSNSNFYCKHPMMKVFLLWLCKKLSNWPNFITKKITTTVRARLDCLTKPSNISHLTKPGCTKIQNTAIFAKYNI